MTRRVSRRAALAVTLLLVGLAAAVLGSTVTAREAAGAATVPGGGPGASLDGSYGFGVSPPTAEPPGTLMLSGGWSYRRDPSDAGLREQWQRGGGSAEGWRPVSIPHDFNADFVAPGSDRGGVAWYEVSFLGPTLSAGRSWKVAFEGVRRQASVWLNGYPIGTNDDPYAPFALPASTLIPGGPNTLVVRVTNRRGADSLPEDWWNWGGITGPVALQPVGRLSLEDFGLSPQLGCGTRCGAVVVQGTLRNHTTQTIGGRLELTITSPHGVRTVIDRSLPPVPPGGGHELALRTPLGGSPELWSPEHPNLYSVTGRLTVGGREEQVLSAHLGLRQLQVRQGVLYLNGRRLWLHGAAIHEDIAGHGAALTDGDIATVVSELKAVHANITRAHYLLSPRLLDALDRAGIMVWSQPPVDHADGPLATAAGRTLALRYLRSTLIGDRNHPSVVIDSVGNELTPTPDYSGGTRPYLQQAIATVHAMDPGAPVALDTFCYPNFPAQRIYAKLDVLGISSYYGWYTGTPSHSIAHFSDLIPFLKISHARYPQQALVVAEFGAEARFGGSASVKGSYAFQSGYLRNTMAVLEQLPFMNGAIYWTLREFAVSPGWTGGISLPPGTAPDSIHHKGLITYDGRPKPALQVAQALFSAPPAYAR